MDRSGSPVFWYGSGVWICGFGVWIGVYILTRICSPRTIAFIRGSVASARWPWHNQSRNLMIWTVAIPLFHFAAGQSLLIGQHTVSRDNSLTHGLDRRVRKKSWYIPVSLSNFASTDLHPSKRGNGGSASTRHTRAEDVKDFSTPKCTLWKKSVSKKSIARWSSKSKPSKMVGATSHGNDVPMVSSQIGCIVTSSYGSATRLFLSSCSGPARHFQQIPRQGFLDDAAFGACPKVRVKRPTFERAGRSPLWARWQNQTFSSPWPRPSCKRLLASAANADNKVERASGLATSFIMVAIKQWVLHVFPT